MTALSTTGQAPTDVETIKEAVLSADLSPVAVFQAIVGKPGVIDSAVVDSFFKAAAADPEIKNCSIQLRNAFLRIVDRVAEHQDCLKLEPQ